MDPIVNVAAKTPLKVQYSRILTEASRLRLNYFDTVHNQWLTIFYDYTAPSVVTTILQVTPLNPVQYSLEAWNVWGRNEWPMPGIRTNYADRIEFALTVTPGSPLDTLVTFYLT